MTMEFHEFATFYEKNGRAWPGVPPVARGEDFYDHLSRTEWYKQQSSAFQTLLGAEHRWYFTGRPYYSLFPAIIEPLARLRLDFDAGLIPPLPVRELVVRFPKGHELPVPTGRKVRALL